MTATGMRVDESQLVAVARDLSRPMGTGGVVHLRGDLGAGKTTFARALLDAVGVGVRIKSPTYSLIESYEIDTLRIHHLDLYRIAAPDELEFLGLDDLASGHFLLLIEWPERAGDALPAPDLVVHLSHAGAGRDLRLESRSARGQSWLDAIDTKCRVNPDL